MELHHQFLLVVSEAYLEEKIACFGREKYGISDLRKFSSILKQMTEPEALAFLDELIGDSSHTVFFTSETIDKLKCDGNDDLESMGDYFVSLWFLLKTLDYIIKSGDPDGIQFFKQNAILLFLSLHSTSSKYLHKGFQELVKLKSMSERMKSEAVLTTCSLISLLGVIVICRKGFDKSKQNTLTYKIPLHFFLFY